MGTYVPNTEAQKQSMLSAVGVGAVEVSRHLIALLGQVDEHQIAQLALGEIGNAYQCGGVMKYCFTEDQVVNALNELAKKSGI